jgi:hypothetical protein
MLKEKFVSNTGTHEDLKRRKAAGAPISITLYRHSFASPLQFASFTRA